MSLKLIMASSSHSVCLPKASIEIPHIVRAIVVKYSWVREK
jgi:hypothetical protein